MYWYKLRVNQPAPAENLNLASTIRNKESVNCLQTLTLGHWH